MIISLKYKDIQRKDFLKKSKQLQVESEKCLGSWKM